VGAGSGEINTTSGLALSSVGVEGSLTDGLQESQGSSVGLDGLHVVSIGGAQAFVGGIVAEKGQGGVQTNDGVQLAVLHILASIARDMGAQAVTNHHGVVQVQAVIAAHKVDQGSHLLADSGNSQNGGGVVHGTSTSPVDGNHVHVAVGEPGIADTVVDELILAGGPAVDSEAGGVVGVEVRARDRCRRSLDLLGRVAVRVGVQVEGDGVQYVASFHAVLGLQVGLGELAVHPLHGTIGLGHIPSVLTIHTNLHGIS